MSMTIEGTITKVLGVIQGEGRNGIWRKQEFLLTTFGQYGKMVLIEMWGDKIETVDWTEGRNIVAHVEPESREHNGRYFTSIRAWKIENHIPLSDMPSGSSTIPPRQSAAQSTPPVNVGTNVGKGIEPEDSDSDLPF